VVNAPFFWASDIGHVLAQRSEAGFAATYMDLPDGRKFSLRSADGESGANVNLIAKEYGGGGHPGAAGFTAPVGWEGDVDDQEEELEVIPLRPGAQIPVKAG
jgi:nanoRNase/pAp phosphatase (c-di-AMP/oligoRNAs hydrolase)